SQVQILSPPLVLTVAKLACRRVTRKAAISGWRPFRVLSPVLATASIRLEDCCGRRSFGHPRTRLPGPRQCEMWITARSRFAIDLAGIRVNHYYMGGNQCGSAFSRFPNMDEPGMT